MASVDATASPPGDPVSLWVLTQRAWDRLFFERRITKREVEGHRGERLPRVTQRALRGLPRDLVS